MGTIEAGCRDLEMELWSDACCQIIRGGDARRQAPAGKYLTISCRLTRTDESGKKWVLKSREIPANLKNFEIAPGATFSTKAGTPLRAEIRAPSTMSGDAIYISATFFGQAGEEYSARAQADGKAVKPPTLRILDEREKVLASGSFEFG